MHIWREGSGVGFRAELLEMAPLTSDSRRVIGHCDLQDQVSAIAIHAGIRSISRELDKRRAFRLRPPGGIAEVRFILATQTSDE